MTWWENSAARIASGHLLIGGRPAEHWASREGTPLLVYSRARLVENYRRLRALFNAAVEVEARICYAMKANPFFTILAVLCAGACGRSMASEFNLRPIAGEMLV